MAGWVGGKAVASYGKKKRLDHITECDILPLTQAQPQEKHFSETRKTKSKTGVMNRCTMKKTNQITYCNIWGVGLMHLLARSMHDSASELHAH